VSTATPEAIGKAAAAPVVPPLRPYQLAPARAVIASVQDRLGLTFTVVMARQAGKNELSAQVELHLLLLHIRESVDGIKCAPTFEPQGRISLRRLWTRLQQSGIGEMGALEDGRAVRVGLARQIFLSADGSSGVVGHTAGLLLEVDEAQDIEPEKFDREFRPMAAAGGATTVYYGTPWDDSTLLEQAAQTNLELERRDGVRRHFTADWTEVARYNPAYGRYVQGESRRLGAGHPLFRTQYELRTVAGGGRLFDGGQRGQLQGSHARRSSAAPGETYVAGLDLAGQEWPAETGGRQERTRGRDATVLTIARVVPPANDAIVQEPRLEVVEHLAVTGAAHDMLLGRLADLLDRMWRVARVAVDATGLGETLCRLLAQALGEDRVRAFRFSAESKSRLGYALIAAVNGGRLRMYAADGSAEYRSFWREMEAARVAYRPNQTMNFFVAPSEGHDDYLMSLALTVEASRDLPMRPRVARGRMQGFAALN